MTFFKKGTMRYGKNLVGALEKRRILKNLEYLSDFSWIIKSTKKFQDILKFKVLRTLCKFYNRSVISLDKTTVPGNTRMWEIKNKVLDVQIRYGKIYPCCGRE
jgi:hypothetical protein